MASFVCRCSCTVHDAGLDSYRVSYLASTEGGGGRLTLVHMEYSQ